MKMNQYGMAFQQMGTHEGREEAAGKGLLHQKGKVHESKWNKFILTESLPELVDIAFCVWTPWMRSLYSRWRMERFTTVLAAGSRTVPG